jgi:tRNA (mo5U34)-methyltransferase
MNCMGLIDRRRRLRKPKDVKAAVERYTWHHSIDLGGGIVTPGAKKPDLLALEAAAIFGPLNLRGKSLIDIGAWNGFFSIEAQRRGAHVLATDSYCWTHTELKGKETFDLVCRALGLRFKTKLIAPSDITPNTVGRYDVVLFLGVFYHLIDPIIALQNIASITREVLVLETHLDLHDVPRPAMVFYPGSELLGDPTNWWGPNRQCIEDLLHFVGFRRVDFAEHPVCGRLRGIFHAYR